MLEFIDQKPDSVAQVILDMSEAYLKNGTIVFSDYKERLEKLT